MNVDEFERHWQALLREGRHEAADAFRRTWNRYIMSKYAERRLPIIDVRMEYETLLRREGNRATALRRSYS